jgi:hypothetical protein
MKQKRPVVIRKKRRVIGGEEHKENIGRLQESEQSSGARFGSNNSSGLNRVSREEEKVSIHSHHSSNE